MTSPLLTALNGMAAGTARFAAAAADVARQGAAPVADERATMPVDVVEIGSSESALAVELVAASLAVEANAAVARAADRMARRAVDLLA